MSRLDCNCLCHGSDGNRIGDQNFACKNCYAANHMGHLRREAHEDHPKGKKGKFVKKPRAPKPTAPTGTVEAVANAVKEAAKA